MSAQTLILLLMLAVLLVVGSRVGFGQRELPAWLRPLVETGAAFILIGAVIGPQGLNLFTDEVLGQLDAVVVIGLGWIGFLYGANFERRRMRRFPRALYAAGITESLFTFALVTGAALAVLGLWSGTHLPWQQRAPAAMILGICAAGTAPAGIFQLGGERRLSAEDLGTLRFFSALDDAPGLVLLALLNAAFHPALSDGDIPAVLRWLGLSVGVGLALGVIGHWLLGTGEDTRQNSLLLLGLVALGAGAAALLRLSPLFVSAMAGVVFANLSPRKESTYGLLAGGEHTLYAVFLLVAGLLFRFEWAPVYMLVPGYVLWRAAAKLGGGWLARRVFLRDWRVSPWIGGGLLFQGGMALAMAVSFERTHQSVLAHQVTTTIVVGVVVSELLAPLITRAVLARGRAE